MSQGFMIFAFNNAKIDYLAQAIWVGHRIREYLDKPVTIVTDVASFEEHAQHLAAFNVIQTEPLALGQRNFDIFNDDRVALWYNANRYQAYAITPYDETIVIDSDYIVSSGQLNLLFDSPHDFLTHRAVHDVTSKNSFEAFDTFGTTQMPHYWATVLYFRKGALAKQIFNLVTMIKTNYKYYSKLYQFMGHPYRNDYAVSLAQLIAYGHRIDAVPSIPWLLNTAPADATITQIDDKTFEFRYEKWIHGQPAPKNMRVKISEQDVHCLEKFSMGEMISG